MAEGVDPAAIADLVERALAEDLGAGDVTAALIPGDRQARARVLCREAAVLCGRDWFEAVFRRLDAAVAIGWHLEDGEEMAPGAPVCDLAGPARPILSGERTALNLLQTLSGTATATRRALEALAGTGTGLLDTRKTLPGLRVAQKYAVRCGGGRNHRMGLYDAYLIKENHIRAAGGIPEAVAEARRLRPDLPVEVEVEDLGQLEQAIAAGAERVLLDNFTLEALTAAVRLAAGRAALEASGGFTLADLPAIAATGVDFVSVGALTKHLRAVDFSMQFEAD